MIRKTKRKAEKRWDNESRKKASRGNSFSKKESFANNFSLDYIPMQIPTTAFAKHKRQNSWTWGEDKIWHEWDWNDSAEFYGTASPMELGALKEKQDPQHQLCFQDWKTDKRHWVSLSEETVIKHLEDVTWAILILALRRIMRQNVMAD